MLPNNDEVDTEQVHSTSHVKLGRRSLTKKLAALGFSSTAVASLTSEDIRAAASDEVPIVTGYKRKDPEDPFSERIRHVEYVPSVWYNGLQRAKRAKEVVEQRYLSKSGIVGVGIAPGEGTERSSVSVYIEHSRNRIEGPGSKVSLPGSDVAVPVKYIKTGDISPGSCLESQLDNWDSTEEACYGGYFMNVPAVGNTGTIATEVVDYSDQYGLAAHHVLENNGNSVEDGAGNHIGFANAEQHCYEDWGLFDQESDVTFFSDVRYNSYNGVTGSYTFDGCSNLARNNTYCGKVGQTTCRTFFSIENVDVTMYGGGLCNYEIHQNHYEADDNAFEDGDSGSLIYNESPDDSTFCWAVGLANYHGTSSYNDHDVWGVGAWRIKDRGYHF